MTFRLRLRVRYAECDPQGIVFNARWAEYIDLAATEYTRAVLGAVDALDWRLAKQTIEWHAPAQFDHVIDISVRTLRVGTTSFALGFQLARGELRLAEAETIYVVVDPKTGAKRPIPDELRPRLERGAVGVVVDQSGARS
jgi:acyl-CoA thioester hydrolase